jgi:DNA-binding protein HU-beta
MKKKEMIDTLSKTANLTKKEATAFFANVFDMLMGEITKQKVGGRIRIAGFGTFTVRKRAARKGLNPQTGKAMQIPEKNAVVFKPSINLKQAVNNKKK